MTFLTMNDFTYSFAYFNVNVSEHQRCRQHVLYNFHLLLTRADITIHNLIHKLSLSESICTKNKYKRLLSHAVLPPWNISMHYAQPTSRRTFADRPLTQHNEMSHFNYY